MSDGNFTPPELGIGDQVLYYEHYTNTKDPVSGWISKRPGKTTVYVMIFSESYGWVERPSVRHIDDPGLKERTEWAQHGAYEVHPTTKLVNEMSALLPQIKTLLARSQPAPKKKAS